MNNRKSLFRPYTQWKPSLKNCWHNFSTKMSSFRPFNDSPQHLHLTNTVSFKYHAQVSLITFANGIMVIRTISIKWFPISFGWRFANLFLCESKHQMWYLTNFCRWISCTLLSYFRDPKSLACVHGEPSRMEQLKVGIFECVCIRIEEKKKQQQKNKK